MKTDLPLLVLFALPLVVPIPCRAESFPKIRDVRLGTAPATPQKQNVSRPSAAKMVSVLQGQAKPSEGKISSPSAPRPFKTAPVENVVERRSKLAAEAAPKGLPSGYSGGTMRIKSGRVPATGEPVSPGGSGTPSSKTLYMKKGNTPAEGIATGPVPSIPAAAKAGRIPAEGDPVPPRPRPSGPSGERILAGGLPGYGTGSYGTTPTPPAPSEITYRVDASSQLSTDTVKFVKGGVELADQASYDYLLTLAEALKSPELAGERFVVEGHASAEGSDHANLVLSQRRANAIFEFLGSRGVAGDRLLAIGHGESQARFADHEPDFLRAQDRQVIVFKLAE